MRIIKIKNCQESGSEDYCGKTIYAGEYYQIQSESELNMFQVDAKVNQHLWNSPAKLCINDGNTDLNSIAGDSWLKGGHIAITETPPFATPTFRTKNDATSSIVEIAINSSEATDFYITEERYVSGGEMIIENAEFGDYVTAEVRDIDGNIPEAYRTALCEDYPTIAKYIVKRWIMPANAQGFSLCELDTRPLTAQISAGFYLRITYYAVNSGSARNIVINYHLTKKL